MKSSIRAEVIETTSIAEPGASEAPERKHVFIKTFGCQMNIYDSERMSDVLAPAGYVETDSPDGADLVILNTCHIREKAGDKVYSELGRIRGVRDTRRKAGKDTLIVVAGCVAQAEGDEIVRRAPAVDIVVGPQSYHRLPALIARRGEGPNAVVELSFPAQEKFGALASARPRRSATAFLTVQEGCDKFCTFCVVPYTRGAEYSRPVAQILDEAKRLASGGVKEVTLLGQNVNAYHGEPPQGTGVAWDLAELLCALSEITGIERLRYTTSHPNEMTERLIAAHRDNLKLMPYLHLPFQAGSDRVLKAMNRKHTMAEYFAIVDSLRAARSDLALSTDIIVGFPGETEEDFEDTMRVVEGVRFAQAYSFKYSPRPGTPAADRGQQVDEDVKAARLSRLQKALQVQQMAFNTSTVGRTLDVLWETPGRHPGQIVGRSPYLQAVHADASAALLGTVTPVEIVAAGQNSLRGVIKSEAAIAK